MDEPVTTPVEPTAAVVPPAAVAAPAPVVPVAPAVEPKTEPKTEPKVEQKWPDNWRELYATVDGKIDEKKLGRLQRYASPSAAFDAGIAAQNKIAEAGLKAPFPDKGTPEEQNAWRRDNGIPESPDKYDLTFEDGLVVGEEDKSLIDDFLKTAHLKNFTPSHVKDAVKWYYDVQDRLTEERNNQDIQIKQQAEDALRAEWGGEFRGNINRINGLLDTAPQGVKDKIMGARTADGTPLASDPDTLKFLINMALQINPATTLVPGAGANLASAIDDELLKLERMMGDRSSEYWKGSQAEKNQKRYRELVDGKNQLTRKAS